MVYKNGVACSRAKLGVTAPRHRHISYQQECVMFCHKVQNNLSEDQLFQHCSAAYGVEFSWSLRWQYQTRDKQLFSQVDICSTYF